MNQITNEMVQLSDTITLILGSTRYHTHWYTLVPSQDECLTVSCNKCVLYLELYSDYIQTSALSYVVAGHKPVH